MRAAQRVHFIGIGGIGMSALAQVLHARGARVSGSEKVFSKTVALLERRGIRVHIGHSVACVRQADTVVWSSAIASDHAEIQEARRRNIPLLHRAELLAQLAREYRSVAVAGTHGKTTTTNMIYHVLCAGGMEPVLVGGGIDAALGSNAALGKDKIMVFEADESDGTLSLFHPQYAVITNIEEEHMGYYRDIHHIRSVFAEFISHLREPGCLVYCAGDRNAAALAAQAVVPAISYDLGDGAGYVARSVRLDGMTAICDVFENGAMLGPLALQVPGMHNVSNALAAVALGRVWGLDFASIARGLAAFRGTARRLEIKGEVGGVRILDDYAHHPTEIQASLRALAQGRVGKLIVVFQPHRYSRVRYLAAAFAKSFALADEVLLTPIYSAGEANETGCSSEDLAQLIRSSGQQNVRVMEDISLASASLAARVAPGDTVIGMGAGDIEKFAPMFKQALLAKMATSEATVC